MLRLRRTPVLAFESPMMTIATFLTPEDAHLFRTFLGSSQIEGFLFDEHLTQWFWHYSNAIGGVRLMVSNKDAEEAAKVYQEYMVNLRTGPYPLAPVRAWPLVIPVSLWVGVPFPFFGRRSNNTKPR